MNPLLQIDIVDRFLSQEGNGHYGIALARFLSAADLDTREKILAFTRKRAIEVRDAMARKFSNASVSVSFTAARCLYRHLLDREVITETPLYEVRVKGKREIPIENVLQEDEEAPFLAAAETDPRSYAILLALLTMGLRESELCDLKWEAVHADESARKASVVFEGKGRKKVRMSVPWRVIEAATQWCPQRKGYFIPRDEAGNRMSRQLVWRTVREYAERIGAKVSPHGVRASAISRWVKEHGIRGAQLRARHESISTTQGYSRRDIIDVGE